LGATDPDGFNLMGMRDYEALIGLKYLTCNPAVKRIGLIGHSGGSSTGNLVVRVTPYPVGAYVSDYQIDYAKLDALRNRTIAKRSRESTRTMWRSTIRDCAGSAYLFCPLSLSGVSQNILAFFSKT
jgi:hypothetical protein